VHSRFQRKSISLSIDLLFALALFAFVTSVTPGPNNAMLSKKVVTGSVTVTVKWPPELYF